MQEQRWVYQSDELYDVDSNLHIYDLLFDWKFTGNRNRQEVFGLIFRLKEMFA